MARNTRSKTAVNTPANHVESKRESEQDTVFALTAPGSVMNKINEEAEIKDAGNHSSITHEQSAVNLGENSTAIHEPQSATPRLSTNKRVLERMKILEEQKNKSAILTPTGNVSDATPSNSSMIVPIPIDLEKSQGVVMTSVLNVHGTDAANLKKSMTLVTTGNNNGAHGIGNDNGAHGIGNVSSTVISQSIESATTGEVNETNLQSKDATFDTGTNNAAGSKSPWLDIVKNNRSIEHMGKLKERFEGVTHESITLTWDDVYKEEEEEARCLIGLFNGSFPGRDRIQAMVDKWPRACKFHFHNSGWIIFEFDCNEDVLDVLHSEKFWAGNKRMIAKQMPRFFNFSKEDYSLVPVWIQLPNLPTSCWKQESIEKMCTFMGKPLYVDLLTKEKESKSFARCCVEMDVSLQLAELLIFNLPDGTILRQPVLYEAKPDWCSKCKKVGHTAEICYAPSVPGVSVYISKSRLQASNANNNRNGNNKNAYNGNNNNHRHRSRSRRGGYRGASKAPQYRPVAGQQGQNQRPTSSVEQLKNDRLSEILNDETSAPGDPGVKDVNIESVAQPSAGTSEINIPLHNKFGAIGSWALEQEAEEGSWKLEKERMLKELEEYKQAAAGVQGQTMAQQQHSGVQQAQSGIQKTETAVPKPQTAVLQPRTAVLQTGITVQQSETAVQHPVSNQTAGHPHIVTPSHSDVRPPQNEAFNKGPQASIKADETKKLQNAKTNGNEANLAATQKTTLPQNVKQKGVNSTLKPGDPRGGIHPPPRSK